VNEEGHIARSKAGTRKKVRELPRILVVDDSDESLRAISTIFKNKGFRVSTAVNGEEALKKLGKAPVDLILSDILMPVMDGFRLLQECKANPALSHILFVFLTGAFTDKKDEELGFKLGADAFLLKPIDPDDLTQALMEVLARKSPIKKMGRKPKEGRLNPESGLYNAAIMQKLEQKMRSLEEEISERKKAESALAKSEEQFRWLFDTMDQGVMCWADGRVISVNPAAASILGLAPEELLGRTAVDPIWKAFHEDGSDFSADDFPVTAAMKSGKSVRDITMGFFNSRDDIFHWIRVSALPQFHPGDNRPYQVYATFDDITDRFFAFKALQESESRMSAILENTQDAMWSVDSNYHLIAANSKARNLYNMIYGATLIEGVDMRSAMPRDKGDFWTEAGQRVLNGERLTLEKRYDLTDNPTYFEYSLSPIISPSGRTIGASISARDITERKNAEQQLRKSEELFRKAVQSTTDIVWDWDIGSGHIEWYGDIDSMLGYHHDEFPRTLEAWENALHPDDRDRVIAALNSHAETGEPYNVEYRIIRRDGATRNWIDRGLAVYDDNGNISHSVGACVDITEHRQSEARARIRHDLALKLSGRMDMETALTHCLDAAIEISGFDTGVIYVLDEKSGDFKAACHYGGSAYLKEHYSVLKADSFDARLKRKGKSIYVTAEQFTTPFDEQLRPEGFTFDATIPVVYQGRVIASLDIFSHTQNNMPAIIRDSLETIAADIGIIIDRLSSRQALQASEEKYRLVVENAREAIFVAQDGMMKFANRNTARLIGYREEELPSMPFVNLIHPDDREFVIDRHLRRLKGEAFEEVYSFRVVRNDSQVRWVEIQAVLIDWEGRPATLNFLTDITDRWQSEQRGRIGRDLAISLIGVTDLETASMLCLDAAIDISGFDSGVVYLLNEETGDFRAVYHRGVSPALVEKLSVLPAGSKWAKLIRKGKPFYVKPEEFTPPFDEQLKSEGFSFHTTIPVQHGNRVIASLGVYSHVLTGISDVVRNSLEAIAADIGIVIERIGTRQELRRSKERYNVIAENTSDAIWSMDKYLRYTYFSPSVTKQRGFTPEEMLLFKMEQVVAPSSIEKVIEGVAGAILQLESHPGSGPITYTGDMEVFCKDGSTIWTETSFTVTSDVQGKFNQLIGISRDITERKLAEKALIESEIKYRSLVETSSSGVAVADETGSLSMVNDRLCQIYGYSRDEVLGRQFLDFIHPDDRVRIASNFLDAVAKSHTLTAVEFRGVRKDGSIVWLFTSPSALTIEGKLTGFSVIIQDITQLKQTEEALKESEQRYRSLFHHNPNAVYSLDLQGRFSSINAAAAALSGYSEEEADKMSLQQVIAPEYLETVRLHFAKACGGEPQAYELAIITKNGKKIDCFVTSTPIIIDGKVIGVYGIGEDITGRKQAAQDLKAALEKASSTLDGTIEAIAMMSELRDPYTAGHQRMVSQLAVAIATELGIETDRIQDLAVAGLMHDVGKVYVPSEILSKPGKLTSLELGLAKAHAEASYNIVKSIKFTGPIAYIVWQHHERMDGSGYPQGLLGDQIMLEARILAVADVVEAMVSHRPYRPALGLEKALDEITSNRGILYDAQVVDACLVQFNEKGFQFRD
jgi:PAS domain S-box-containing protein